MVIRTAVLIFEGKPTCDRETPDWKRLAAEETDYGDRTKDKFADSLYDKVSEYESEFGRKKFLDSLDDKALSVDTEIIRKKIVKDLDHRNRIKELRESKHLSVKQKEKYLNMLNDVHKHEGDPKFVDVLDADGAKKPALVVIPTEDKMQPFKYHSKDLTKTTAPSIPSKGYTYDYEELLSSSTFGDPIKVKEFMEMSYKINGYQRNSQGEQFIDRIYNSAIHKKNTRWEEMSSTLRDNIDSLISGIESVKRSLPLTHVEYKELVRLQKFMEDQEGILSDAQIARYEELKNKRPMIEGVEGNKGGFAIHHATDTSHPDWHIQEATRRYIMEQGLHKGFSKDVRVI